MAYFLSPVETTANARPIAVTAKAPYILGFAVEFVIDKGWLLSTSHLVTSPDQESTWIPVAESDSNSTQVSYPEEAYE